MSGAGAPGGIRVAASAESAPQPAVPHLAPGLVAWVVFSALLVFARGVRWDENYEFAQVLAARVHYPDWHPLAWWVRNLVSAQLYVSALMLDAGAGAYSVCLVRNLLFVWATVVPPYLLGAALAQRALAGHAAAALILSGVHTAFDGSYPQFTLPGMFSNGHIGTGFVLCAIAALALGRVALGFFLIGLTPAVHIGQLPPLLLLLVLVYASRRLHPQPRVWRRADAALVAGLGISVAIWIAGRLLAGGGAPPISDASPDEIRAIWGGWVTYYDMHRRPPGLNSLLMTVGFVLLAYAALFGLRIGQSPNARPWIVCFVYSAVVLLIGLVVMLAQTLLGANVPYVTLTWLPYRLWNHVPPIMVAMICAILLQPRAGGDSTPRLVGLAAVALTLGFTMLRPLFLQALPATISYRYFGTLDFVVFFLFGAAFALLLSGIREHSKRSFALFAMIGAGVLILTALVHQFGTMAAIAGVVLVVGVSRYKRLPGLGPWPQRVFVSAIAMLAVSMLWQEWRARQTLAIGDFERAIAAHLESSGHSDAMLLGPMDQVLLQAQTGHPVVADLATPFFIGYRPSFGPQINGMFRDVYGVDFRYPEPPKDWREVWAERTAAEWSALAEKYGFEFVVSPIDTELRLPVELDHYGHKLYRAPAP